MPAPRCISRSIFATKGHGSAVASHLDSDGFRPDDLRGESLQRLIDQADEHRRPYRLSRAWMVVQVRPQRFRTVGRLRHAEFSRR
jgi:hypothetical protein